MASFSESDTDGLDFRLMQNGAITLYFQRAVLEADLAWLRDRGYRIETIDCREPETLRDQLSEALRFNENYGHDWNGNLNALNDGFGDVAIDPRGGTVFCFLRYDLVQTSEPSVAHAILDIIESNSRFHLLFGRRLLALVQSDDPRIQFEPLGARPAQWNRNEWLDRNRGL